MITPEYPLDSQRMLTPDISQNVFGPLVMMIKSRPVAPGFQAKLTDRYLVDIRMLQASQQPKNRPRNEQTVLMWVGIGSLLPLVHFERYRKIISCCFPSANS